MPNVTVKFEMSDGRTLKCEYGYKVTPGNYSGLPENCYPDEVDVGELEYFIDDYPVEYSALPKGLNVIADAMYEDGRDDPRFSYKEEEPNYDGPEYDPRIWDEPY